MCDASGEEILEMTPPEVTDMLLDYVTDQSLSPQLQASLTPEQQQQYQSKCRLYRLALVLMFALKKEHADKQYTRVRDDVETRVFGQIGKDIDRDAALAEIRAVMTDLRSLLSPSADRKELSWALRWLEEFDLPPDPFDLTTVASRWMDHAIVLEKTLGKIRTKKE